MRWLLNTVYLFLLTAFSPFIAWRIVRHGRYRNGIAEKLLGWLPSPNDKRDVVWFHAVSVGEVIQLQKVVEEFRCQTAGRFQILVSTSTDTGFELAQNRFPDCQVTWFPLDFSWSVRRAVGSVKPRMVVLMELELWPNLLAECHRKNIPVAVINARMSERSHRGYSRIRQLMAPLFGRLALVGAQSQSNADRLQSLGVSPDRLHVTGSIKFDGVATARSNPATDHLRNLFGLSQTEIVFMAGSTQEPEERLALQAWRQCRIDHPSLRLILVPRHRERFDEVATFVRDAGVALIQRSSLETSTRLTPASTLRAPVDPGPQMMDTIPGAHEPACRLVPSAEAQHSGAIGAHSAVILLDSIGELSACWGLADIAFVGGSFGNRGGQNMIEPAAFGAAVLFGPNTRNFRDVVYLFKEANSCVQLQSPEELTPAIARLLADPVERQTLGLAAQTVVKSQTGATVNTVQLLLSTLGQYSTVPGPRSDSAPQGLAVNTVAS